MTRFFISYDRDDRSLTRQLATQLRRVYGYNDVWYDENIYGGAHWWEEIRKQIDTCDIFIFMLSEESAKSPYCEKERVEAERTHKEILPVRISQIKDIPEKLRQIQYVDMSEGQITVENFTELNAAIRQISQRLGQHTREASQIRASSRTMRLAFVLVPLLIILLGGIGLVAAAPQQPFQGQLTYSSGRSATSLFIEQGGLSGAISSLLGQNPRKLDLELIPDTSFSWSQNGQQIAFTGRMDSQSEIFVAQADGSNPVNLSNDPNNDSDPSWSPDASQLAFTSNRSGDREIWIMAADGSNPVNLSNNPGFEDAFPAWSPDGTQLAFASNRDGDWDIYLMDVDGANVVNLTENDVDDQMPTWSPLGDQIAFESNRVRKGGPGSIPGTSASDSARNWDIYVVEVDGGGQLAFTRSPGADRHPAWSPDGNQIAFVSDRNGDNDLFIKNVNDRTKDILVVDNIDGDAFPVWRP